MDRNNLAAILRLTEKAHAEYERSLGKRDDNWADWYAEYMIKTFPANMGVVKCPSV